MSKPSVTPELFAVICKRLAAGESLLAICKADDMPWRNSVLRYVDANEGERDKYARARDDGLDVLAEQLLEISDHTEEGQTTVDKPLTGIEITKRDMIEHRRLKVDTRKWYLSKLAPKRYGDRIAVEHSGTVSIEERLRAGRKRVGSA